MVGLTSLRIMAMKEDEIQILGRKHRKFPRNKYRWLVLLIVLLLAILFIALYIADNNRRKDVMQKMKEDLRPLSELQSQSSGLYEFDTEVNDVHIYTLHLMNVNAQLTQNLPQDEDTTILLSALATSVQPIEGDLVIDGRLINRGKPMNGFCAIIDGNVAIGETTDDDAINYCIEHKGSFFRQHLLIKEGKIMDVPIKGKAPRCALVRQGNDMYFVYTPDEESVHDFAEVMVDIGVLDALLLDESLISLHYITEDNDYTYEPDSVTAMKEGNSYLVIKER